jgi:predicted ArsR family transcriptional regulator
VSGFKSNEIEAHKALSVRARRRILDILSSEGPQDIIELSKKVNLKTMTLRHHLRMLEHAKLVETVESSRGVRGRPKRYYRVRSAYLPLGFPKRQYPLLANELVEEFLSRSGRKGAISIFRRIGEKVAKNLIVYLTAQHPNEKWNVDFFKKYVIPELERLGCRPEILKDQGRELVMNLKNCIYFELAKAYPGIICEGHKAFFETIAKHMGFRAKQETCMAEGDDSCITVMKKR